MRKYIIGCCVGLLSSVACFGGIRETYQIGESEISGGYIIKRIWLEQYMMPEVKTEGLQYTEAGRIPEGVQPASDTRPVLRLGMERKRPFLLIQMPAYISENGQAMRLSAFTLSVNEQETPADNPLRSGQAALLRSTASGSPLASGSWYKISVDRRGIYKVDYEFMKNIFGGGNIPSTRIRLFGHGGTMLPEDNAAPRHEDLPENAITVFDGGDGSFGPGDYFLFYSGGPGDHIIDTPNQRFLQRKNLYEDESYYFLTVDAGNGLRTGQQSVVPTANITVNSFNDYVFHEEDLVSLGKIGKEWVGELFSTQPGQKNSETFSFTTGAVTGPIDLRIAVASQSSTAGRFIISVNGQVKDNFAIGASSESKLAIAADNTYIINPAGSSLKVGLEYQCDASDARGYLNFITLNMRRPLSFSGSQLSFRDLQSVDSGNVARYELGNAGGNLRVWDVTDPVNPVMMNGTLNGSVYSWSRDADILREFIAFDGSQYLSPKYLGKIGNQDLHSTGQTDYIIVTHPDFTAAAERLAAFHREHNNLRTIVVTTPQIYNEFSSGSQDISAIRNFVKMLYDRAGQDTSRMPKYLLLFGDASYDYKNRIKNNTNYVPAFESGASYYLDSASCNDDFFAILDDHEYIENSFLPNTLDIGVGRLPARNPEEANQLVDKILHYKSSVTLGPWRLSNTYVSDNEDNAGTHMVDAEIMAGVVDTLGPIYNDTKIHLDNIPFVSTPGGTRAPEANKMLNDQVFKGTFMINYSGHGNTQTLAHERILTADDFNAWKNMDKLPFMVTATCDFSQFDNPEVSSAGEKLILKKDGGVIAMLTTTQAVYAGPNRDINRQFLEAQFAQNAEGQWHTFGDAFRIGKNNTYITTPNWWVVSNFRKFVLLGDPALTPNFPKYFVHTESVKDMKTSETADSVSALGGYVISGKVTDAHGQLLNDFDGTVYISFYDKPREVSLTTKVYGTKRTYHVQNNIIYKGKASVSKGKFSFSFIVPKDINYNFGKGKISYYAENGVYDAAGADSTITIGGASDNPFIDDNPPVVKPYMNDSLFRDGGITGTNTLLYVSLHDETGINVSGNSIGHDLTGILDGEVDKPFILNDYYETAENDYQRGFVHFPVTGLADGPHTIRVKAWDMNNNSGEGLVSFFVYNGEVMKVEKLMNYPNPFSEKTHFVFEHNHPGEDLRAQIIIYNSAGALVRTLDQPFIPEGSRTNEIIWDGTGSNGAKLPPGLYVYRLKISTASGIQASAYQKLVLIR